MRKITISLAIAIACLAGSAASADPIHHNDHHGAKDFGGGGWSQNVHVRPFPSGAITVARTDVTINRTDRWELDHRLLGLDADSDCPLASLAMTVNQPRRAGCK